MGTNTATVMTLANSIIGVSVLAMPFCFKQCGIVLSILMLICSSFVSRLACHFLLKAAIMARRRNFEFLAFHIFGSTGKFTAELFIIGFLMGTCIAFFVVMGDLGPAIVAKALGISNTDALRPSVLIGLAVFVVLPLGLLRNVDSLASVCTITIAFYGCLVLKVMAEATPHLLAGDWLDKVHLWRPAGIMQCIPIFSMALFCQTQLFEIYETLHNASLERMNDVIRAAVNMCTGVYVCVGFFGYVAYCTLPFSGNVMMSFTPSALSEIIKVGFVLSVAVSFPLVIFPCRASLYSLLFRRMGVPHHEVVSGHIPETRFKCLTVFIISVALLVGLLIPNIELVLGLVGSTIGVLICVAFPAAAFICVASKSSHERLLAQVLLFVGMLILVLGTYATLYAAHETAAEVAVVSPQPAGDKAPPAVNKLPVEVPRLDHVEQKAEAKVKMKEEPELPATAEARQEPPVPMEPQDAPKLVVKEPDKSQEEPKPEKAPEDTKVETKEETKVEKTPEEAKVEKAPERKEEVDQDAIRREEEELAEAERRARNDAEKKDAELLRKLEKHEEQQIKLLQEQKQILQALQAHKKEIERSKNLTAVPVPDKPRPDAGVPDKPKALPNADIVEKPKVLLNANPEQQNAIVPAQQSVVVQSDTAIIQEKSRVGSDILQHSPPLPENAIIPEKPRVGSDTMQHSPPVSAQKIDIPPPLDKSKTLLQKVHPPEHNDVMKDNVILPIAVQGKVDIPEPEKGVKQRVNIIEQAVKERESRGGDANLREEGRSADIESKDVRGVAAESKKPVVGREPPQVNFVGKQTEVKQPPEAEPHKQQTGNIASQQAAVANNFLMERLKSPLVAKKKPPMAEQEALAIGRDILSGREREKRDVEEENCDINSNPSGTVAEQNTSRVLPEEVLQKVKNATPKVQVDATAKKTASRLVPENVLQKANLAAEKNVTPRVEDTAAKSVPNIPRELVVEQSGPLVEEVSEPRLEGGRDEKAQVVIKTAQHLTEPKLRPLDPQPPDVDLLLQEAKPMKRDLKSLDTHRDQDD